MIVGGRRNKSYTEEDLLRLPDNGKRHELVEGKLVVMSPAGFRHGEIAAKILTYLGMFLLQNKGLGTLLAAETGFRLKPGTVRGADVAFVAHTRLNESPDGYANLAPDLAVEVISPNDTDAEVTKKVNEYLELGVRLIWVIHPGLNHIVVYRRGNPASLLQVDDELDGEDVLPGFKVNVRDIFTRY